MPFPLHTPVEWAILALFLYGVANALTQLVRLIGRLVTSGARSQLGAVIFVQNQGEQIEGFLRALTASRRIPPDGLLVVDLASTDDTGEILDRIAKMDDSIRVLHLPAETPSPYETALFLCRSQTTVVVELRGDVDARPILQTLKGIW